MSKKKNVITVATKDELMTESYYRRLWIAARNLSIPRRGWLDKIAACFCDFQGDIVLSDGKPYDIPFVDDVFGDDQDMRWLSYYLSADKTGKLPRMISRKIERVQVIDLYFRIKHPQIAEYFEL